MSQYVLCQLADECLGIPVELVREVLKLKDYPVAILPGSPPAVEGLISPRGQVVVLRNGRKKLGLNNGIFERINAKILILEDEDEVFGLLVDEVQGISQVTPETSQVHDKVHTIGRISGKNDRNASGRLILLLSKEDLFTNP